jgi:acetoin utilization deacetylase AcuC-like enzyme
MNALRLFYCDHHSFPLPDGHKFPTAKYRMVRDLLAKDSRLDLKEVPLAAIQDLQRVHTSEYIHRFLEGTLDASIVRRIGFPWSQELVMRTLASAGGTLEAVKSALKEGCAGTLAGGTHHAFRSEGAGFCVFNDLAVAAEWAKQSAGIERIAIVDLDVHQGDGTASIFEGDESVFTLSLHGARNFPVRKQRSRLDIEFPDETGADQYLLALDEALKEIWRFNPSLILYQSGVDGLASDRLGRLSLTLEALEHRDQAVLQGAKQRSIPIAITMGGGYSDPIGPTVEAHVQTYRIAATVFGPQACTKSLT